MTDDIHHFRNAFIAHHSMHNFSGLSALADNLIFCSTGYEPEGTLATAIEKAVEEFDPTKDILVPVGNVASNLLLGAAITRKSIHVQSGKDGIPVAVASFFVAVYKDTEYHVSEVTLGADDGQ